MARLQIMDVTMWGRGGAWEALEYMTSFLQTEENGIPNQEYIKPQEYETNESNDAPIGPDPVCLL